MTKRIISAVVLSILMASVIIFAPVMIFEGIVLLIIMGGLYEFFKLTLPVDPIYREAGWIWGIAVACSVMFFRDHNIVIAVLLIGVFIISMVHMGHSTILEGITSRIGVTLLGVVYLGATLPFWGLIRTLEHGRALIFLGIASAALCDTFAMFAGKTIGRRKFAPLTSPNKTWEGFFAGIAGSIFGAYVAKAIAWPQMPLLHVLILGLLIGFVGPMGDLIESLFKRDYHVKDSGSIIPGHGGFLDRLDAMIFTGPLVYCYALLVLPV